MFYINGSILANINKEHKINTISNFFYRDQYSRCGNEMKLIAY